MNLADTSSNTTDKYLWKCLPVGVHGLEFVSFTVQFTLLIVLRFCPAFVERCFIVGSVNFLRFGVTGCEHNRRCSLASGTETVGRRLFVSGNVAR